MMSLTPPRPMSLEGLAFAVKDLRAALEWEAARPGVRVVVTTDHKEVYEAVEVYPPGSSVPRWCVWRDRFGGIHLDDWQSDEWDLRFLTLSHALEFISEKLPSPIP